MTRGALVAALVTLAAACGDNLHPCDVDGPMCARLSDWHLFKDIASQTAAGNLLPYTINTPLFADYTTKDRWIDLPPNATIGWSDNDALDLPVGTILVKTFSYLHDRRDPSLGRRLLETRLLLHGSEGWHGASYVYDADGKDATLQVAGATVTASWIHDDGTTRTNDYVVPNENQCKTCHAEHDDIVTPLGPKARHLNRAGPDGSGIPDQLQNLIDAGALVGAPAPASWPRLPDAFDPTTGTLDQRAHAWLDINCGHCHNPTGYARTSGLFLDVFETAPATFGTCKPPVATGPASGGLLFDIVPGNPDASILVYRIAATEPATKMPPIGRNLVQDEGVALMRQWIAAQTGGCP